MRAAVFYGPYKVEVADRPDPDSTAPTDAVVRGRPRGVAASARLDRPRTARIKSLARVGAV